MFNALIICRRLQPILKRLTAEKYSRNRLVPILRVKMKVWREVFIYVYKNKNDHRLFGKYSWTINLVSQTT